MKLVQVTQYISLLSCTFLLLVNGIPLGDNLPSSRVQPFPRRAVSLLRPSNSNDSVPLLQLNAPNLADKPSPAPWTFIGPKALYVFNNYKEPRLRISWIATFLITCLGDIVDVISNQGFHGDQSYPGGIYTCKLEYPFPAGPIGRFGLKLERVAAPGWNMTFSDVAEDLEALYYAALWFEDKTGMMPGMDVETHRYRDLKPKFLASRGKLFFTKSLNANDTSS